MATFYIGQRVRIVQAKAFPSLLGQETTITGYCEHCYDCYETPLLYGGVRIHGSSHNFEPILPQGLESPEEIKALWEPSQQEKVRVRR